MIYQLDPPVPIYVIGKGKGLAHALIDYGIEHDLYWITFMDSTGECWTVSNPEIRAQKNTTIGRDLGDKKMANWIKDATKNKGGLHRATKTPMGEKISSKKMAKAAKSKSPKVRKEVALAKTLGKLRKKK